MAVAGGPGRPATLPPHGEIQGGDLRFGSEGALKSGRIFVAGEMGLEMGLLPWRAPSAAGADRGRMVKARR